jgi:hypothetical protein
MRTAAHIITTAPEEWTLSSGTETRQLTQGVYVRFTPDDLDTVKDEAERRDMSVAQLLRENTLRDLRAEAS